MKQLHLIARRCWNYLTARVESRRFDLWLLRLAALALAALLLAAGIVGEQLDPRIVVTCGGGTVKTLVAHAGHDYAVDCRSKR